MTTLTYRQIMSVSQVAEAMSIHPETVRRMALDGRLPSKRHGTMYVFDAEYINGMAKGGCQYDGCEKRHFNTLWTYGGEHVPVCWYHFHMLMMRVLGIGRETAVGVADG